MFSSYFAEHTLQAAMNGKLFDASLLSSPKRNMQLQLKELVTNEKLNCDNVSPNLNTLANISLSIPFFICFSGEKFFTDETFENSVAKPPER